MNQIQYINTTVKKVLMICIIFWIGIIFYFSNQPADTSQTVSEGVTTKIISVVIKDFKTYSSQEQINLVNDVNAIVRKLAHAFVFFVLAILSSYYFYLIYDKHKMIVYGFVFCFINAGLDEFHQLFVVGRACQLKDVLIDMSGASIALLIMYWILLQYEKRKEIRQ